MESRTYAIPWLPRAGLYSGLNCFLVRYYSIRLVGLKFAVVRERVKVGLVNLGRGRKESHRPYLLRPLTMGRTLALLTPFIFHPSEKNSEKAYENIE